MPETIWEAYMGPVDRQDIAREASGEVGDREADTVDVHLMMRKVTLRTSFLVIFTREDGIAGLN